MQKNTIPLAVVLVAVLGIFLYSRNQTKKEDQVRQRQAQIAAAVAAAKNAEEAKERPRRLLAEAIPKMTVGYYGEAQAKLDEIIIKYPSSPEAVKAKELLPKATLGDQRDIKNGTSVADIAARQAGIAKRGHFAKELDKIFLDSGMDVKIILEGKAKEILKLEWVLWNRVTVHKFTTENNGSFMKTVREQGFKQLHFQDGYDYAVYSDL